VIAGWGIRQVLPDDLEVEVCEAPRDSRQFFARAVLPGVENVEPDVNGPEWGACQTLVWGFCKVVGEA